MIGWEGAIDGDLWSCTTCPRTLRTPWDGSVAAAQLDNPHKNRALTGVVGMARPICFTLTFAGHRHTDMELRMDTRRPPRPAPKNL